MGLGNTSFMLELGGPSGKLFRFVSCVRARGAYVRSDLGENLGSGAFPFPFLDREVFPFPSALQGPIQLQLALSVPDRNVFFVRPLLLSFSNPLLLCMHLSSLKRSIEPWYCDHTGPYRTIPYCSGTGPYWSIHSTSIHR